MSSRRERRETDGHVEPSAGRHGKRRSLVGTPLFRLGRALFGGILAFMAVDNLCRLDERVEYARSNGAPMPELAVPGVSTALLLGSLGVALWRRPTLSAAAVVGFFVSVTPVITTSGISTTPSRNSDCCSTS